MSEADDARFEPRLVAAKAGNLGQILLRAARLYNEEALARLRQDPRYAALKARHLAIFPHLDLEGTRVTTLAQRMEMTKQGVGQLVDELEALGVLARIPDPEDGRAKRVRLTPKGQAAMLEGLATLGALEEALVEALGRAELTRLKGSLLRLSAALEPSP
jgi:DNA-binding MarR family transcriptional regulator